MPSSVYLHDGEQQITVRFPTEEDRERFKAHYRALDALAVQFREERDRLRGEVAALREVLAAVEWGTECLCPSCHGIYDEHKPDCALAAALATMPADARGEEVM